MLCPASPRTAGETVQQDGGKACPHCAVPSVCVSECVCVRERSKMKFKILDHSLFSYLCNSYRMVVSIVSDLYKSVRCTYY